MKVDDDSFKLCLIEENTAQNYLFCPWFSECVASSCNQKTEEVLTLCLPVCIKTTKDIDKNQVIMHAGYLTSLGEGWV